MVAYPPSTADLAASRTPERTARLNTRGAILPAVEFVMHTLQAIFPRRVWLPDNDRLPTLCPIGWRRGGTSPGGADVGGPKGGSYFVGSAEEAVGVGAPQRMIWVPQRADWAPATSVGSIPDVAPQEAPPLLVPGTPANRSIYRAHEGQAAAPFASRLISFAVHVWGNDLDDTEELVGWLGAAVQVCFQGTTNGEPLLGPEEWVPDPKGSRGIHCVLGVRFGAPVFFPPDGEAAAREVYLRLSGQAPHVVVEP